MEHESMLTKRFFALLLMVGMFVTLIFCFSSSAEAATQEDAIDKAVNWLKSNQNESGNWGNSDVSFLDTSEVAAYLTKNNDLSDNLQKSAAWMEKLELLNNDVASRILPYLGESDKYSSVKYTIKNSQNSDGGWGIAEGYESDVLDTSIVLNSLVNDENIDVDILKRAVSYIISTQNSNGSWSLNDSDDATISLTAQAAITLNLFQTKTNLTSNELQTSLRKAGEYLVSVQNEDKTWGTDEASIADTLLSYRAVLSTIGLDAVNTVDSSILNVQNPDGSWYESPYITALAITAIKERMDMPSAEINSIKLYRNTSDTKTECYSFNAYETFEIQIDSTYNNLDANLLYFIKDKDGKVEQIYLKGEPVWDTSNSLPGTYLVVVAVQDSKTGKIITSSERNFDIAETTKINSATVSLDVDATTTGSAVNVNVQTAISNASNIKKQLKIKTVVLDGEQEVFSSERLVELEASSQISNFDVLTFSPNVDAVKDYVVRLQVFDGETILTEGQSVFKVLALPPTTRVDVAQSLDKKIIYPRQDSVLATFKLKGEGILLPKRDSETLQTTVNSSTESKENKDYIQYVVGSDGRFTVGTTIGNPDNPNDDNKKLLYGHPSPGTSYTTVKIDGNNYIYAPNTQRPTTNQSDLSNTSEYTVKNLSVKQIISIVPNTSTNRKDVVRIKYIITNNDSVSHDAGLRIMLDTMLGSNDAAPFRIPGIGAVTTEIELIGDKIPEYWQAFDSLTYPTVISNGTLFRNNENKPDKVQFVNWGRASDYPWMDSVNIGSANGDSAVNVYWNPKVIAPGETREYVTYYGLSELQQDLSAPLAVSLTGANNITIENFSYNPNPFTVTAYISNISSGTLNNVKAKIILPDGLKLITGEQSEKNIDLLASQQEQQCSWNIGIEPSAVDRNLTYSVVVFADGVQPKILGRSVYVPALYDDTSGENVVFETCIPKGNMNIDTNKLNPVPSENVSNLDGSTILRWKLDKIAIGEEKLLNISYEGTDIPSDTEVILTQSTKMTYQDRNGLTITNNLSDLKISVSKYMLDSKVVVNKDSYTANENVNITNTTTNLADYPETLTAKVEIIDTNGNCVKTITENESYIWNANETKTLDFSWNTGSTMAGKYFALITWSEGEKVISVAKASFDIVANSTVSAIVVVNKQKYTADEDVHITSLIKNNSTNSIQSDLMATTSIKNPEGEVIWKSDNILPEILQNNQISLKNIWNTAKNPSGQYTVTMDLFKNTEMTTGSSITLITTSSSITFEITSQTEAIMGVSGSLEVQDKMIYGKDNVVFNYNLNNTGNTKLENVTARIRIVDTSDENVVGTITDVMSIDVSSSQKGEQLWTHEPLKLGSYMVVLDAIFPDGKEVPLANSSFTVGEISVPTGILTDKNEYSTDEIVNITISAKNLTNKEINLDGKVFIIDPNGTVIKNFNEIINMPWKTSESKNFKYIWNTDKAPAGEYKVRIVWTRDGIEVSSADACFNVLDDKNISCSINTDKQKYISGEEVNLRSMVMNNSQSYVHNNLLVKTKIQNAEGETVWNSDNSISELLTESQSSIKNIWNIPENISGQYTAIIEVYNSKEKMVASSSTAFEIIKKVMDVSGSLEVQNKDIYSTDDVIFKYKITNIGNVKLDNVTAQITVLDADTEAVLDTMEKLISIDTSSSYSEEKTWTHKPMELGDYIVKIDVVLPNGKKVTIAKDSFTVVKLNLLISDAFKYTLFSGDTANELQMNLYKGTINGNIHTNKSLKYSGTSLNINGVLSSVENINTNGSVIQFNKLETDAPIYEIPNVATDIRMIASKDANIRRNSLIINEYSNGISFTKSEISKDSIKIFGTSLDTKGYIIANNSVTFNLDSIKSTAPNGIVICSANSDITINATNTNLKGVIYAPNGTVYINSNNFKLEGRIIAKRIVVQSSNFEVSSTDKDLDLMDTSIME